MAKRVRIEFISSGFHDLLSSSEVAGVVMDAATDIADSATSIADATVRHTKGRKAEFEVKGPKEGGYGGGRQIAYVAAANPYAYGDAVRHHVLERAVNARRIH